MKKKGKRNDSEDISFWQPASDMFSALLLILMLVILLLGLYLVQIPENSEEDPWVGDTFGVGANKEGAATFTPQPTIFIWFPNGGGGGGADGETPHPTYIDISASPTLSPSPSPTPSPDLPGGGAAGGGGGAGGGEGAGEGPGEEPDLGLKAAVYVMLVDAETERSVKIPNVEFELYNENRSLQILNSYYPEHLAYRFYETSEDGYFYLPEKIPLGKYELHQIAEAEGYDMAENQQFSLEEAYDWADPYVVRIPVAPSRDAVRVQMQDAETGRGIGGGSFDVIASDNIITADGTLRYRSGQVIAEIVCDETGYGESEEIFLGTYLLRQKEVPQYYVSMEEDLEVTVNKKTTLKAPITQIASQRSKITFRLSDALTPERGIRDSVFTVTASDGEPIEMTTDSAGRFVLDTLEKTTVYQISQTQAFGSYRLNPAAMTVSVAADGRIDGEPQVTLEMQNYMIRVSIGITDEFSSIQVPNIRLSLFNSADDTAVRTWTTTAAPQVFTDLAPGDYYVIKDGDTGSKYRVHILDQAETQEFTLSTSYLLRYIIIGGAALLIIALTVVVIIVIRKRKRRKAA